MKSSGKGRVDPAFMGSYTMARKVLCGEHWATSRTSRKSVCSKKLYITMIAVWKKMTKVDWRMRFALAVPFLTNKVEKLCRRYARRRVSRPNPIPINRRGMALMKRFRRRRKRAYHSCMKTVVRESVAAVGRMFSRFGMSKGLSYLVLKRDDGTKGNYTFKGALEYLSAPVCYGNYYSNISTLAPRCVKRPSKPQPR